MEIQNCLNHFVTISQMAAVRSTCKSSVVICARTVSRIELKLGGSIQGNMEI